MSKPCVYLEEHYVGHRYHDTFAETLRLNDLIPTEKRLWLTLKALTATTTMIMMPLMLLSVAD